MSGERRASPDRRYFVRRSAPVGRIVVRASTQISRTGARKKPRSWPTDFWFKSQLFARGTFKRRKAFERLIQRVGLRSWSDTPTQVNGGDR